MEANFEYDNDVPVSSVQAILEELAGGRKHPKHVLIYTYAKLNVPESRKAGHRVYDEVPFILIKHRASQDAVSRPVTEEDKRRFPREWERYQRTEESALDPEITVLPACTLALEKELSDMGYRKISALLANAESLTEDRFAPVIKQAKVWQQLNEENDNDSDT